MADPKVSHSPYTLTKIVVAYHRDVWPPAADVDQLTRMAALISNKKSVSKKNTNPNYCSAGKMLSLVRSFFVPEVLTAIHHRKNTSPPSFAIDQ